MNPSLSSGLLTAAALIAASLTSSEVARSQTAAPATSAASPAVTSASAAPVSASPTPIAGPSTAIGTGAPKLRKQAPPPPAPTPAQLKAFGILQQEAHDYEVGSKDFRRNLTMIVRHHYEQRRQRVLTALDREITEEKHGLDDARQEAIARLERFVERYSGENADPRSTPDAMFRLGALYEERARANNDADLTTALEPALAMYRRLIKEFPHYEEIAAVHYYLGHGYTDAGRIEEGQQAWRSLVCSNRYTVKSDPKDPGKIALDPLPQDHDDKFCRNGYNKNPVPLDQVGRPGKGKAAAPKAAAPKAGPVKAVADGEERVFADPYDGCKPLPQKVEGTDDPRYLAEIWWQLGNFHFDQIDPHGGPYNLNRAVSAYDHSMEFKKPPIFGVAMYKQAWTYYKQQRYKTAVEWFVKLLHYADEQEAKTGDPGADFRSEAYTYIAGSLTYVDFDGPPPELPYIPRNDVLDTETDPVAAENKMAIAIQRVQDQRWYRKIKSGRSRSTRRSRKNTSRSRRTGTRSRC